MPFDELTLISQLCRSQGLSSLIIDRCRRRESSLEEALMEMRLAGVSVRRVEDITQALGGHALRGSPPWRRNRPNQTLSYQQCVGVRSARTGPRRSLLFFALPAG